MNQKQSKYKCILIDQNFHERNLELNYIPFPGQIIEVSFNKKNTILSKFKVTSVNMKPRINESIFEIHVKYIGRS